MLLSLIKRLIRTEHVGLVLAGMGFLLVLVSFINVIPPRPRTVIALSSLRDGLVEYATDHNVLPGDLKQLLSDTNLRALQTQTEDGWGRPIQYTVSENGIVLLTSLGSDGLPGGTGEKADLVGTFNARMPDGSWRHGAGEWLQYPDPDERQRETTFAVLDLKGAIVEFAREHGELPTDMAQLPDSPLRTYHDGWGRLLRFTPASNGTITISNNPGGPSVGGEDTLSRTGLFTYEFQPKKTDGSWLSPQDKEFYAADNWRPLAG